MSTASRLEHAFRHAPVLPLSSNTKYILMSDCHRGTGTSGDNFLKNQHLYFAALKYYYQSGFTYIELGDGDELWENRKIESIIEVHNNIFWMFSLFHQKKRLYLLYGNHDIIKKKELQSTKMQYLFLYGKPEASSLCFAISLFMKVLFFNLKKLCQKAIPYTRPSGKPF